MKRILTFILLSTLVFSLKAQLVHVKGVKGVFSEGNYQKNGFSLGVGYSKIQTKNIFWKAIVEFHNTKQSFTKTKHFNAFGEAGYNFLSFKQKLFFNVTSGLGAGVELLQDDVFSSSKSNFVLTESAGLCIEWCPIEKLTTAINFRQRFTQFNKNGSAYYMIGLSVQYNLN